MRVVATGYVYDPSEGLVHQRNVARTNVLLAHDGTLYVAFRWGSDRESLDGHEAVFASTDLGATWENRFSGFGKGAWDGTPGEVKGFDIAETSPGELTALLARTVRRRDTLGWSLYLFRKPNDH